MKLDKFEKMLYLTEAILTGFLAELHNRQQQGAVRVDITKDPLILSFMTVRAAVQKLYQGPDMTRLSKSVGSRKRLLAAHLKKHEARFKKMVQNVKEILNQPILKKRKKR